MTAETIWDRLQVHGEAEGQFIRLRFAGITACAVYAARRTTDGHEAVVLEVAKHSLPPSGQYPDSRGFSISAIPLREGRSGGTRLVLSLQDVRYRDVFLALSSDLFRVLGQAGDEHHAVELFISRLSRWQAFLRRHGPEGLSLEARRGLMGELLTLRDILLPDIGPTCVGAWTGPSRASHDYELPGGSLEVKTTTAATPSEFRVSNVLQLDDAHTKSLFLILVLVQEHESAGETLPEVVESLREDLSGEALDQFEDRLVDAGFLQGHLYLYQSPRYSLRSIRPFRVVEGFPRIVESTVPSGVTAVSYDVAVGACLAFSCEMAEMVSTLKNEDSQ